MTPAIRSIVVLTACLLTSNLQALPPVFTVQGGAGSNDIGSESDSFYYLTGAALLSNELSRKSGFELQAEVSTYDYSDNSDLSSEEIFLQGTYRYTPRAGFRVPTYSLGLRYLEEFLSKDELDASTLTLILSVSYPIDDRTGFLAGVKLGDRDSDSTDESDTTSYFVNFDFRLNPNLLLYTTLGLEDGAATVRSYCSGGYNATIANWSGWAATADDCDNSYVVLGANYAISAANTLDVSVSVNDYDTPSGSIDGNIYSIDFFHRF